MKNFFLTTLLGSIMILGFYSCKKQAPDKANLSSAALKPHALAEETDPDEIKFDNMVQTAALGLLNLRTNSTFRQLVNAQVDLRFDDDDDVLLKTLNTVCADNGINLGNCMRASLNNLGRTDLVPYVDEAINGFSYGLDESDSTDTLYLQIYIPSISTVDRNATPVIAENHEEGDVINAYNVDGSAIAIDEAFASASLTWVISANEVVNKSGKEARFTSAEKTTSTGDNTILIKKLRISQFKETFPNGASEMCYAMYRQGSGCNVGGFRSIYLGKFKHTETSLNAVNETWIAPLSDPFSATSTYNQNINCLWYERDVRKKFRHTEEVIPGCSNTQFTYRSKEGKYGIQSLPNEWITNWTYGYDNYISSGLTGLEVWQKWE